MIKRLPILDCLRGLAALLVVLHHYLTFNGQAVFNLVPRLLWNILSFLNELNNEAVLFFFVLSGFCIALATKGHLIKSKNETNLFLYKRFKRILPVYLLALLFSLIVGWTMSKLTLPEYAWSNLIGNLLFLQTSTGATDFWFSPYGSNGPLWSLAYEMFFYLVFPLYSYLLLKKKYLYAQNYQLILLFSVSLTCIALNKFFIYIPYFAFLSYFVIWIAGFLVACHFLNETKNDKLFIALFLCGLLSLIFHELIISDALLEVIKGLWIASFFYIVIRFEKIWRPSVHRIFIWLTNVFSYVGHGSYALYALHYPLLMLMNHFKIALSVQLFILMISIILCPMIEQRLQHLQLTFLNRNYLFWYSNTHSSKS
ncbi:acyltransferase family protein [Pedobacter glucosidilyticus]|uniref:acyltransferase family protein n=1 Tax=Pedobacter glucosidilyticus TaxID=1122941 RepID=UPI0026EDD2BF|nr:acyltransferase [Pedobacter glucosidilyticus]